MHIDRPVLVLARGEKNGEFFSCDTSSDDAKSRSSVFISYYIVCIRCILKFDDILFIFLLVASVTSQDNIC